MRLGIAAPAFFLAIMKSAKPAEPAKPTKPVETYRRVWWSFDRDEYDWIEYDKATDKPIARSINAPIGDGLIPIPVRYE